MSNATKFYPLFQPAKEVKEGDEWEVTLSSLAQQEEERKSANLQHRRIKRQRRDPTAHENDNRQALTIQDPNRNVEETKKCDPVKQDAQVTKDEEEDKLVSQRSKCSILRQLVRRSITGKKLPKPPQQKWSPCKGIRLMSSPVVCMAWDHENVLLTVATCDKYINVFDWDTVVARDIYGRRHSAVEVVPITPWSFQTPYVVSSLQWSSHDQLAVSFR
jgi:hypothetical protein